MKTALISALMFLNFYIQAQDYSSAPQLERRDKVMYSKETDAPYTGSYNLDHPNGKPFIRGEYRNGLKEGKWVSYDSTGTLKSEEYFVNDQWHNKRTTYYPNGQVEREINFINGIKNGVEKGYYQNGQLHFSVNHVNGLKEGKYVQFHPNGKIWEQGSYQSDLNEGKWINRDANGRKTMVRKFEKNEVKKEWKK
jgi:antitoxin component YwqK of YwqJK toxin-antitoxin module